MTIGELGEFELVRRLTAALGAPAPPAGPGDDAALVPAPDGRVVAGTDLLVEGVHFRLDWSSGYDIGRKAAAANLADIAAMGAVGRALLVAVAAPSGTRVQLLEALAAGLRDEAARAGAAVVGGDTAAGPRLVVAVTALGDLEGRPPVTRAGARPGHQLVLAGVTGPSAAGLRLLADGVTGREPGEVGNVVADLLAAHLRPQPPYASGPALARAGAAAMCDVSDGLLADAGHLAAASGVRLELDRLPLPAGVRPVEALTGGEDHALLAALPPHGPLPAGVRAIGRVVDGAGVVLAGALRSAVPVPDRPGFDHFAAGAVGRGTDSGS